MSVWLTIPSCRPAKEATECFDAWRDMGYRIAIMRQDESVLADVEIRVDRYKGWARSINELTRWIIERNQDAQWFVGGGDDTWPDPNFRAGEIAEQCCDYLYHLHIPSFEGRVVQAVVTPLIKHWVWPKDVLIAKLKTFGVMQPTGDDWSDSKGRIIERFAGSPWMGREWCKRAYQGNGPLFSGYLHNWADEELQAVAIKQGVFWQRPDLTHMHKHWLRQDGHASVPPGPAWDLIRRDYDTGKPMFERRRAAGWPGSEPKAAMTDERRRMIARQRKYRGTQWHPSRNKYI